MTTFRLVWEVEIDGKSSVVYFDVSIGLNAFDKKLSK